MIVDAHSHMLQVRRPSADLAKSLDDLPDIDIRELLAGLDRLKVEMVVTMAQVMDRVRGQWLGSNELAADLQHRYKDRFIGIAAFEPITRMDQFNGVQFEQVRELVKSGRIRGLLVTPPYGHFQINDRRAYPFYQMAVEYNIPIYVHQGAMYGPTANAPQYGGNLWTLDQVVVDFPDLRFNIEHMAWPWTDELLAIMAHGPNVYTDLCMLSRRPHTVAWHITMAGDYGFLDRVFWGSDYVGADNTAYLEGIRTELDFYQEKLNPILKGCGWPTLSSGQIDGLLGENIRKLLSL